MAVACAGALLVVVRLAGIRSTRSGLVGGMLGPLFVVAIIWPAHLLTGSAGGHWMTALGAALLLAVAALAGAHVAERLEGDRLASAGLSWAGSSLLLSGLAWNLYGGRPGAAWLAHVSIPIGVLIAAVGLRGRAAIGPAIPRTHFGGLLLVLSVGAAAVPFWPWWLPWLFYDRNLPDVVPWPPNFVFVALEARTVPQKADPESRVTSLEVLRVDAVTYPSLAPEPEVGSLLMLPDGDSLEGRLHAAGYATAAIGPVAENLRDLRIAEVDDRPGGRRLLAESAAWMAGAPLLLGPASGLLGLLGHDRSFRSPEEVGDEAARWILSWRTTRAPAPFLLFVDLRTPGAGAEALDAGLRRILDRLQELQLDSVTLLVIAAERSASAASAPSLVAHVILPSSWRHANRLEAAAQVWGRALGQSLLQIALSDGESPVRLSGLNQELSPPKLR